MSHEDANLAVHHTAGQQIERAKGAGVPLPPPRAAVTVRAGTMADLPFIDSLQKKHSKQVGFMPEKALVGKVEAGHVLIAEEVGRGQKAEGRGDAADSLPTDYCLPPTPVGYCIGNDQYFKHDDVGVIYQLNVVPGRQRGLIGATLLKAMFDRAAYGCKLFCCWCAQDIEANRFWEACGFVPLAYRAGSETKQRVHIFWSKRIRDGDTTTPWWFPSETKGGSMMEDRLVFPIPPGTHWSDAMPIVLPRHTHSGHTHGETKQIEDGGAGARAARAKKVKAAAVPIVPKRAPLSGGLMFQCAAPAEPTPEPKAEKPKRVKPPKVKNDPTFVAAARELRDRYLERVNADPSLLLPSGKYQVSRMLPAATMRRGEVISAVEPIKSLPQAA